MNVTSLPALFCAALGLMLAPLWGPAAVAINFSSVNALGSEGTPTVDLDVVGATDWFALDASGEFGAPAVKDQKAGGIALAYGGSTGLFSAVNGAYFNLTWSDGSATPAFDGPSGYYVFGSSATQTFTAEIAAGATSTITFFLNSGVEPDAVLTVKDSLGLTLLTLPIPVGFDARSSIAINYTATADDTVTFEFGIGPAGGQFLGVIAVGLVTASGTEATTTIQSSTLTPLGDTGTPPVDLAVVGTTDWLALDASGPFGSPGIKDRKAGGTALSLTGSTGLFGGGNNAYFALNWTDGTTTPVFNGGSGYFIFGSSATQTFTAEIAAGATSTLSFFLNTAVDSQAKVTVRNGLGTRLLTQPLALGYDLRSSLVITYSSTIADTLTFEFSLGPTGGQILGVAAVGLVSSESATLTAFESWRLLNFGTTATTGLSADYAPEADADGDGLANLLEFALGGDPLVADPARAPTVASDGERLSLSFQRIADPALTYRVEGASSLADDSWEEVWSSTGAANVAGAVSVPDAETLADHPRRFLRLRVSY